MQKAIFLVPLIFLTLACEKGFDMHGQSGKQDARAAATEDQAPVIILELRQKGETTATVATFKAESTGTTHFSQDEEVTFDFSRTTDDRDGTNDLEFAIDFGSGFQSVPAVSRHVYSEIGVFPNSVRVSDAAGNSASKSFNAIVQCPEGSYEPLAINPAAITINPGPANNYFIYDAGGSVSGGRSPYKYKWDFNGDEINDNSWHAETAITAYTVYSSLRNVRLKAWDTGCNVSASLDLGDLTPARESFDTPMADGVPGRMQGPQIPNYTFLQAKLQGRDGNAGPKTNADLIISDLQAGGGDMPKRVHCRYNKNRGGASAPFTATADAYIEAFNLYEDAGDFGPDDEEGHKGEKHGMILSITGINDPTGSSMSIPATIHSSGRPEKVEYYTDGDADSSKQQIYLMEGDGCRYDVTVRIFTPGDSIPVCTLNPDFSYAISMDGTFSCPELKNEDGKRIEARQGAFYCEQGEVRACIPGGGGGGGGGNPPPIPL